jgi:hypothetical protein
MAKGGAKVWYFPDGELPQPSGKGSMEAHEALMVFNLNTEPAKLKLDIYFKDRNPIKGIALSVPAERVVNFRLDHPDELGGAEVPRGVQYALRVRSSLPVVCQFARLDTTQTNMAYYVNVGLSE